MSADALRSSLIPFVAAAVLFVSSAHPARSQDGKTGGQPSTIVFICEHGSSRSFVAASLFNRIAEQRGLAVRALSRAVSPETVDKKVPPRLVDSMTRDGFAASTFEPALVTRSEAAKASRIVVINYDRKVEAIGAAAAEHWDGVPAASLEYDRAKELITSHIEELLRGVSATPGAAGESESKP